MSPYNRLNSRSVPAHVAPKNKPHQGQGSKNTSDFFNGTTLDQSLSHTANPVITSRCAEELELIRQHPLLLSFVLTTDHAIPEAAARVHDLRSVDWSFFTPNVQSVKSLGRIRRNAALYSLGVPEWPYPGFATGKEGGCNVE